MEPPSEDAPPVPYISYIHKSGQDTLWATYVISVLATLFIAIHANRIHIRHRALHLLALITTGICALSYFAMATHSGVSYVSKGWDIIEGEERPMFRQVFWARYIGLCISAPPMALAYSLLAGLPWVDAVLFILGSVGALLSLSFGALLDSHVMAKWGWYMHACLFVVLALLIVCWSGWQCAKQQHTSVFRHYTALALAVIPLAILILGTFALGEGAGVIDVNTEVIAYAIFDVLCRIVLPIWIVLGYEYDNKDAHVTRFSDEWTKVRGGKSRVQLPEEGNQS